MKYWIWLSQIPYVGPITANQLLKEFNDPENIYFADSIELGKVEGITKKQIDSIINTKSLVGAEIIMEKCKKIDSSILPISNSLYPSKAKQFKDAPVILYYKGELKRLDETVGIVGARRCIQSAKEKAISITKEYTLNGKAIISGMAKGIDSYAHTACLKNGGYTVAILGNGLDICYPSEHSSLMNCIVKKGLLISEYPPETKPTKYTFPRRNRLISAWSDQLVVIAPGKGSGAIITAEYGRKYGREVSVVLDI